MFFQVFFLEFWPYVWLVSQSGFKSRAGYDNVRTVLYYEWALTEGMLRVALAAIRSIATCYSSTYVFD